MPVSDQPRVVADRYRLDALLGRGGMGKVWRAEDTVLERTVAVKEVEFPLAVPAEDREALRRRVLREARLAARLAHPGVVTVFDVVEDDGRAHIVMELVDAPTLAELVARDGPLPPATVAALGVELLDALSAAHAAGVIHRDVKPANVMVLPNGRTRLADFGIALAGTDPRLTSTGVLVGSPSYMAPEQARGEAGSPATDLWGLGATLYFAVEGVPAFDLGQAIPTLTAVVHDPPRPTERAGPLAPLLARLLAKDPLDRPSADQLRLELRRIAHADVAPAAAPVPARAPARAPDAPVERRPRPRWPLAVAALVVIAIAAVALAAGRDGNGGGGDGTASTVSPATTSPSGDLVAFTDAATGFRVGHPKDWKRSNPRRTQTRFTDPHTGAYLVVEWQKPAGPSAEQAWRDLEQGFRSRHAGYRQVRIEPTTFEGSDNAAVWEYTYDGGGGQLHAIDLGAVLGDYGFALNWQAKESDWARLQPTFQAMVASFQPPA